MEISRILDLVTSWLGSIPAVVAAVSLIVGWALTGPVFGFSESWQLFINSTTTVITYIMVFIVQHTQNRDGRAIQTKLDAILKAIDSIPDELMGIEEKPEKEIKTIQSHLHDDTDKA